MKLIRYTKSYGGQSKCVWLYIRIWHHTFYIGNAPQHPDGKYRIEIIAKNTCCPNVWFRFSKYKPAHLSKVGRAK